MPRFKAKAYEQGLGKADYWEPTFDDCISLLTSIRIWELGGRQKGNRWHTILVKFICLTLSQDLCDAASLLASQGLSFPSLGARTELKTLLPFFTPQ
ncbi:hypothetical protein V8F06_010199 [Rhypophila decipiens]